MKTFWFVLLISLLCFFVPVVARASEKLKVVATNSIVEDWVRNVAGDLVDLTVLVGPNSDVHTFEPTPLDNVLLSKADIVFEIGLGLEHWMDKLFAASQSRAKRVALTSGVIEQPLTILRLGREHHQDMDPHVWHNVHYVIGMVKRLSRTLKNQDPANAQIYEKNTQMYLAQLQELDSWILRATSQISKAQRQLVTNHDSLGYFCERYQFVLVGAAFDSATTEAEDPSARDMAQLIAKIKKTGVHAVFAENIQNSKVITSLAKEANIELAPSLYTDALGSKGSPAETYIKMIRYNVQTIVSMLKT
ncbi:MAG: zinc ABC transporter substrate-binding protein [Candidatus Omnitrophica bacterium]|nr:zinc ABC transporter substrate-binding protein [Candidatus Omnitrophota bacterium]